MLIFLAIFFCPRDLVYKMVQLKLVAVVICIYNEILRANKVYKGLEEGKSAMPAEGSVFFIPVLIAILKVIPTTHSSEIRGLCLMKCSSETLQNLPYFWNMKTHVDFFILCYFIFSPNECLEKMG